MLTDLITVATFRKRNLIDAPGFAPGTCRGCGNYTRSTCLVCRADVCGVCLFRHEAQDCEAGK